MKRPLVALFLVVALVGCSAPGVEPGGGVAPLDPDTVALITPQSGGMHALLEGELVITDECVTIRFSNGAEVLDMLPVFSVGSVRWEGESLAIYGEPHANGSDVELGGGFIAQPGSQPNDPFDEAHIPAGCTPEYVFLVNPPELALEESFAGPAIAIYAVAAAGTALLLVVGAWHWRRRRTSAPRS